MLCEICHENEARVTYTEIINGVKKEQHLCESCAAKQPPFSLIGKGVPEMQFGNILSGLLQSFAKGLNSMQEKESICGRCGMTASEFAKSGRLGCPDCYNAFAPILDKNLRTVQGTIENKAKRPMNAVLFEPSGRNTASDAENANRSAKTEMPDGNDETGSVLGTAGTMEEILGSDARETSSSVKRKDPERKPAGSDKTAAKRDEPKPGKAVKKDMSGKRTKTGKAGSKPADPVPDAGRGRKKGTDLNAPNNDEIVSLRKQMEAAVKDEDYEEAARLRDLIRSLEGVR